MNLRDPQRADALAGEYVLGTLRGRARQRFARLARTERILADAVRGWEERLLPLAEALSPIAPPSRVWAAILARIRSAAAAPRARSLLWTPLGWWRGFALVGLATSLALAVALLKPAPERLEGTLVVVLAGQDAKPALVATSARASRYLTVKAIAPVAVAPDRALELWMLPAQGNPRSLGLVSMATPAGVARIELPAVADQALQNIPALAISLEPAGGSPTGLPTGPVLYSGPVQRLY
ncbi:MAG: anti-sigma factor [Pseudomonadota bacterium]|nr:anti-sigma factor [Pseudomonadota bacterium]